mgnify:CR=1 FL=1
MSKGKVKPEMFETWGRTCGLIANRRLRMAMIGNDVRPAGAGECLAVLQAAL